MNFFVFCIYIPLVHSVSHTFVTTYTGIYGQTPFTEFSAVTTLDGQQIDYYDSEIKKLIPKQDWMKDYASTDMWKADTEIREQVQHIYTNNIHVLMQRFNQTSGVHTYQRIYGCEWDDETDFKNGSDQYVYDGEDFISLDINNSRYITSVPQAFNTVQKWNKNKLQLQSLKQYYNYECIYWLKEFLHLSKSTSKKTVSRLPGQSLTESIQTTQTVIHTESSGPPYTSYIQYAAISVILILIALCVYCCRRKLQRCLFTGTKEVIYYRENDINCHKYASPPEQSRYINSTFRVKKPQKTLNQGSPTTGPLAIYGIY